MARWTSAAATEESTPPDSPQTARASPTWARMASTWSWMTLPIVHVGAIPAISWRKCSSTAWPCAECSTSGWNWTPARRRSESSNAATGVPEVRATTSNPAGAWVTASPWLIHTD